MVTKSQQAMAQYINKSALVAEIKKRIEYYQAKNQKWGVAGYAGRVAEGEEILSYINTLEVKEVDLEKEIGNVWNPHFNLGWDDNSLLSINHKSFESIAKHFFNLGLKTQIGE